MSLWQEVRKRLGLDEGAKLPLHKKMEQATLGDELVGPGPVPPFRSKDEKARAEIDTGTAAFRNLTDAPAMTKEKFKQTFALAQKGSEEARRLINKLGIKNVETMDPDQLYDAYFVVEKDRK